MSVAPSALRKKIRVTVVAADGLSKRDVFRLPDPFAVITVDAEQTHTTSVIKKTLNPYWNESFDITVKDSSVVAVQIFDQRKFKRRDQGFLGVVNVRVSDVLDLGLDYCHEMLTLDLKKSNYSLVVYGKLIIYFSTDVNQPNYIPGPSQVSGSNTAMPNPELNTSSSASTSNLALPAGSPVPRSRTASSHTTASHVTAQTLLAGVKTPITSSSEQTPAVAPSTQSPVESRSNNTVVPCPVTPAAQPTASFSSIDWEALARRQVTPPFKPVVESDEPAANFGRITLIDLHEEGGLASSQTEGCIDTLLTSWELRLSLLSMTVPEADRQRPSTQVSESLGHIGAQIGTLLVQILNSRDARHAAQRLERDRAQSFVDAIQNALDQGTLPDSSSRSKARKLMQKISEAQEQLPSSLFITGVNDRDEHPTFGGGFSDVYQASYQGKTVALKRLRTFTADSTPHRTRLQFYKEALVWQGLRHPFVLPLLGIDRSTFAPSFCMVSPWMKHGTVLKYLQDHGRGDVNRLLLEIAQGLDYLHSMNVVHGDLRGTNILISDDGNACLSDFGLAMSIDDADSTTAGATSSSNRAGSVRWFAPELIDPTKFGCPKFVRTKASDVYAYACVCLELYTRNPPFSHLREIAASLRAIQGERPEQPPAMPTALWQLVTAAWAQDFRARPSLHNIAIALEGIP